MRRFTPLLLLFLVLTLPVGGRAADARPTPPADAATMLDRGLELYRSGHPDQALPVLRGFVIRYADDPGVREASLVLARIFLDQDRPREALLYLQRLDAGAQAPEVRLLRGLALTAAGDNQAGREALLTIDPESLGTADRAARLEALATATAGLGQPLAALTFLHGALPLTPGKRDDLLTTGRRLLRHMNSGTLAEAAFMFHGTPLGAEARLAQAESAEKRGDLDMARRLAEALVVDTADFPHRREAVLLYQRLTGRVFQKRAVGVLLPLSGRYAAFGNLVRRGLKLALKQNPAEPPVPFIYRDSGSDPDTSAAAVDTLLYQDGVLGIAGPITGSAAQAAALRAQQEGVPLLTLSQREGLGQIGGEIFRDSLTPRLQAEALARYALEGRGLTRFGVLYPENRLGREMTALFTEAVARRGGRVVARESYPEDATDFRRQIRLLMGKDPNAEEEEPEAPVDPLKDRFTPEEPTVDFDALFIPDYADRIALIAPQLPFYGIENLPLLGINGWNSPELVRLAGQYVEGAVFVDGFFAGSSRPEVQEFVADYRETYGDEPTILEAQGFEVANLLLRILDDPAVTDRTGLQQALTRLRDYPGVTGTRSFDAAGEAVKDLFLLQVKNGRIVEIEQPEKSDER